MKLTLLSKRASETQPVQLYSPINRTTPPPPFFFHSIILWLVVATSSISPEEQNKLHQYSLVLYLNLFLMNIAKYVESIMSNHVLTLDPK